MRSTSTAAAAGSTTRFGTIAALEVGRRDDDERGTADRGGGRMQRQPEGEHAAGEEECRRELDRRVARRDPVPQCRQRPRRSA